MATQNPFDLLGDDDSDDLSSLLIAAKQQKPAVETKKSQAPAAQLQQAKPAAKLPGKPLPPAQAVREAKGEGGRGGGRGRGYGRGRGVGGGFNRELANNENTFGNREFSGGPASGEETDAGKSSERRSGYGGPRGAFRGPRRGGFSNGEMGDGERPRRPFDRRSGTGRGNEIKREGAGRGNWGNQTDELVQAEEVVNEDEKTLNAGKLPSGEEETTDATKETPANETEEKEPENKEMTLEEYEKVLEEKRKALQALKTEERKVDAEVFASMQQLANKKNNDDIFIKLSSDRDKKKEAAEKEEKAKKAVSINEFLKPAEGERYYSGGRGRGRGRGHGGWGYGGGNSMNYEEAPAIEDPGQFPSLGGK